MHGVEYMSQLSEGQRATVVELQLNGSMRRRLQDMGLIPGTGVRCLRKAPSGSPVIYEIRGTMVALRSCDAGQIRVSPWV